MTVKGVVISRAASALSAIVSRTPIFVVPDILCNSKSFLFVIISLDTSFVITSCMFFFYSWIHILIRLKNPISRYLCNVYSPQLEGSGSVHLPFVRSHLGKCTTFLGRKPARRPRVNSFAARRVSGYGAAHSSVLHSDGPREGERGKAAKRGTRTGNRATVEVEEKVLVAAVAAPAATFSGEPLNRVVFAEESWDHPK